MNEIKRLQRLAGIITESQVNEYMSVDKTGKISAQLPVKAILKYLEYNFMAKDEGESWFDPFWNKLKREIETANNETELEAIFNSTFHDNPQVADQVYGEIVQNVLKQR